MYVEYTKFYMLFEKLCTLNIQNCVNYLKLCALNIYNCIHSWKNCVRQIYQILYQNLNIFGNSLIWATKGGCLVDIELTSKWFGG